MPRARAKRETSSQGSTGSRGGRRSTRTGSRRPERAWARFERFKSKIDSSRHKSRYHFLGWIPAYQLADVCEQAHIAINLDRFTAEAELGFRNRLILWMWNNAAVVSTALSDQLRFFEQRRLIRAVPVGDPHAAADAILELAKSDETRQLLTERARAFLADEDGFQRLMEPLARWAASPSLAPDRLESLGDSVRSAKDPATPPPAIPEVQNPLAQAQRQFVEIESLLHEERRARHEVNCCLGFTMAMC